MATRHFVPREYPFAFTNGVQASWLEVDTDTGFVKLLRHWVVEDCGTIINPQLVDEQIRGGVVQGLGAALFEKCVYDERGQLTNANMADYLVPMAGEMPDIDVGHVVSPTSETELGAKGAGEAGTAGAAAAVANAVIDALRPFGAALASWRWDHVRLSRSGMARSLGSDDDVRRLALLSPRCPHSARVTGRSSRPPSAPRVATPPAAHAPRAS